MGITKKQMEALARKNGVRGARLCGNQPVRRVDGVEDDATIQHERAVKF